MTSDDAQTADLTNWRLPPFNRWAFHHLRQIMPVTDIPAGASTPMDLPRAERSFDDFRLNGADGQVLTLDDVLRSTATDAIVILKDGALIYEAYFNGLDAHTPHILMSSTKAITGLLAGILEHQGKLELEAPATRYVPEVAGSAFEGVTVRQLIDMRSGVRLDAAQSAAYTAATGWDPPLEGDYPNTLHDVLPSLSTAVEHGGPFAYISANTDLAGWVMERAAGAPFATLVSEWLWKPLGAQDDAFVTTDDVGSARAAGGMNATARDFARLGQVMIDGGRRDGRQVLPEAWLEDIAHGGDPAAWRDGEWGKAFGFISPNMRYRAGWYIVDEEPQTLFAMGIHGQNLFLDPTRRVVIAKLSSQGSPIDYTALPMTHRFVHALQEYLA